MSHTRYVSLYGDGLPVTAGWPVACITRPREGNECRWIPPYTRLTYTSLLFPTSSYSSLGLFKALPTFTSAIFILTVSSSIGVMVATFQVGYSGGHVFHYVNQDVSGITCSTNQQYPSGEHASEIELLAKSICWLDDQTVSFPTNQWRCCC
ncbi:unnamed protein product [Onchocerca flexuosa]|uniref:Transmembrane protein n=1 Tax=Onchocerca flexuosa TaxID=387005 RepID=A0A183H3N5_9BILA|nr:unnamed protein product [Onchocerca flexuosa]